MRGPLPNQETRSRIRPGIRAEFALAKPADGQGVDGHLTPSAVADLAARARAGRLVLTHLYPPTEQVDVRAAVARRYPGPVSLAADGDRFELGH